MMVVEAAAVSLPLSVGQTTRRPRLEVVSSVQQLESTATKLMGGYEINMKMSYLSLWLVCCIDMLQYHNGLWLFYQLFFSFLYVCFILKGKGGHIDNSDR